MQHQKVPILLKISRISIVIEKLDRRKKLGTRAHGLSKLTVNKMDPSEIMMETAVEKNLEEISELHDKLEKTVEELKHYLLSHSIQILESIA